MKEYILNKLSTKYFYIEAEIVSFVSNKNGLLTDNNLYEEIMKEQYVHSELIDAIIESDSDEIKIKFVNSISRIVIETEKIYNSCSYEHKVLNMANHPGIENIKDKIEILISDDKTIALSNISHHNRVVFKDKETGEEYVLQLSQFLPSYSESTELIDKIIRAFPDMKIEELRNRIFEVGKAKDKDSIFKEMSKFLQNAHQLAFFALYLKYKGTDNVNINDYSLLNASENLVLMNFNRNYYTNDINYIDPSSLLAPIYKEIDSILKISNLKPKFKNPYFQILSKPFLEEGIYICSPLKYDLKDDPVCQKQFMNDWFIEYHNNYHNIQSLSIDGTISNNNESVQIEYKNLNKKNLIGFEPDLCIYPSEYAIESENLPQWVLDWINKDNSKLKLNFLALLGLNTESSDIVQLRKVIMTSLGNSSLDKVKLLGSLNKGYLERSLLYAMYRNIEIIEDSTCLLFIKSIYLHIDIITDVPLLFIKSVDDNGKIHYYFRNVKEVNKFWLIKSEDLQYISDFINKIVELLNIHNELLLDYRCYPEECSSLKNVDSLRFDITLKTGDNFTEFNKNYYKIWRERLGGTFRIYQCNDPGVKSLEYQYSLMGTELFIKFDNDIDISDNGSIYFIYSEKDLEELLTKIVGKRTFTQNHLDLLIQLKSDEPEEIRKQYDIEFEPINNYDIHEQIRINDSKFPVGEIKSFEDKLIELINAQQSKWKSYIYHFTHLENAVSIINTKKIKSRNSASFKDSAGNSFIQSTQEVIKNYARFYFRPKTPTQYYNERLGKCTKMGDLSQCPVPIFFKFSLSEVLKTHKGRCYISNGNLRHYPQTNFGNTYDFLKQVNFNNLYSEYGNCELKTYLIASQQEFIVEGELDFSIIKDYEIICPDEHSRSSLLSLIDVNSLEPVKVIIDNSYYYADNPTIYINYEADKISISKSNVKIPGKLLIKTEINISDKTVSQEIETDDRVKISSPDNPNVKIFYINTVTGTKWLIFYKKINM